MGGLETRQSCLVGGHVGGEGVTWARHPAVAIQEALDRSKKLRIINQLKSKFESPTHRVTFTRLSEGCLRVSRVGTS